VELLVSNGFIEADGHLELSEDAPIEPIILARSAVESFIESSNPTLPVATPVSTANLSLKQKALIQQEEKKIEARKLAKIDRQEQLAKIEQDKLVRSKDENWSAQAAGVKGGKAIETYRGKFGEDQGGG
jgi:hypothetical protein